MRIISSTAETFEEETSEANREDAVKERDEGKNNMESGEEKRNQDNKRRRLQSLATEKELLDKFLEVLSPRSVQTRSESYFQRFGMRTTNERRLHD